MSTFVLDADAHTKPVEHWTTWKGKQECKGELMLTLDDAKFGYKLELYDTGKLYTLRVYYWGHDQDASKEGYMFDWKVVGSTWDLLTNRGRAQGLTDRAIAMVESAADEEEVTLR